MVNQSTDKKPTTEVGQASPTDIMWMFYIILKQNNITIDRPMEINVKAFKTIQPGAKICGKVEDGMLSVWLPETRQMKRKKARKLILPDKKLILPKGKAVHNGK